MKTQIVLVFCLFLSHWISPGFSQDNKYARLNRDVTLSPVGGPGQVESVVWKFGNDKVAEYDPTFDKEVQYYGSFRGRTTLDLKSGNITISKLTHQDEGKYSVEVNNKLLAKTFSLKPLENVGKPVINSSREGDQSILTCEGKATEYSSYTWWSADNVSLAAGDQLRVNKTGDPKRGYKCRLRNPVSEQTSNTVLEEDLLPAAVLVYSRLGGEVPLESVPRPAAFSSIEWIFNSSDTIARWENNTLDFYGGFQNRTRLNTESGQITVASLTAEDDGVYTAKINNRGLARIYQLKVIAPVSKPTITPSCSATVCVLTCKTESSEVQWCISDACKEGSANHTVEKEGNRHQRFSCRVSNPVGSETSRYIFANDLFHYGLETWEIILIVIAVIVIVVVAIILAYIKRDTLTALWNKKM